MSMLFKINRTIYQSRCESSGNLFWKSCQGRAGQRNPTAKITKLLTVGSDVLIHFLLLAVSWPGDRHIGGDVYRPGEPDRRFFLKRYDLGAAGIRKDSRRDAERSANVIRKKIENSRCKGKVRQIFISI